MASKYLIFLFYFLVSYCTISAQSYKIDTLRTEYRELETYNSIGIENDGSPSWEKKFDLPFVFPSYDSLYTHIICNNQSVCYFEFNPDFDIKLMAFSYSYDRALDINNIKSDVRYNYLTINNKMALVIQFTKMRLNSDKSVQEFDSYINYQLWFFEDGAMEVHFGDINLDNSPNYRPGEGFYFIFGDGTEMNSGPGMGVTHPTNEEDQTWLEGDWNDYIVRNNVGYLTTLPPTGFVIRFTKKSSSLNDEVNYPIYVYPNPTDELLTINYAGIIKKSIIKSINGENIIVIDQNSKTINTAKLSKGMYFLQIHTSEGVKQTKFIKS
jgi:hypothetical protein